MAILTRFLALSTLIFSVNSQDIGVSTCACQPSTYTFQLNFDLTCSDRDVRPGDPGIIDTACVLNPQGNENVTDLVPVRVTEVQILELDQNLQVIFQTTLKDNFVNGAVFNYSSITYTMPSMLNDTSIPKGIQVFLTGRNANEEDLVNFWAIVYDNDCGVFPLLTVDQQMGWTVFTDLGEPPQFLCPAVGPAPTEAPSVGATTEAPTRPDIDTSVPAPTTGPTSLPETDAPTGPVETDAPTEAAVTDAPTTDAPTVAPVAKPPTSPAPVSGCPELPINSGSVSSSGFRRRQLMVRNTASPTACPEPAVVTRTPSAAAMPHAMPHASSSKGSKGLPKKKKEDPKKPKASMQKLTKGTKKIASSGSVPSSSKGASSISSSSSSKGAGQFPGARRFLMDSSRSNFV